ncbi:hypothetical protein [Nonomuraea pusilla]|uniref:Uncharacterized protein n=1 Tax=Nonomuraea pusilla TaxID=46177 RepID=A0A1H7UGX6_9ACTN|nr:hypothetical protein [Nonomuraea pusilla]SEL95507.1 hypothetical protein SAMN05660976_03785 [Nonomuraea pusilla]
MTWILVSVALGVAGLAVLAVAGVRVVAAARTLRKEVAAAQARLKLRTTDSSP